MSSWAIKTWVIVAFVLLWNTVLYLIYFFNSFDPILAFQSGSFRAFLISLLLGILSFLYFTPVQKLLLKKDRTIHDVKPMLWKLIIIIGLTVIMQFYISPLYIEPVIPNAE